MNSIVTDPGHARGTCVFCHGLGNASGKIEKHHGILCVFNDVRMDSLNFTMLHLKSSISLIWGSLVVSVKPRFKQCCSLFISGEILTFSEIQKTKCWSSCSKTIVVPVGPFWIRIHTATEDEGHVDLEVPGPVTAKLKESDHQPCCRSTYHNLLAVIVIYIYICTDRYRYIVVNNIRYDITYNVMIDIDR